VFRLAVGFLLVCFALPVAPAVAVDAGSAPSPALCATSDSALQRGQLEKARDAYMDVLAGDAQAECAIEGLREVTQAVRAEERLCEEGAKLAKGGEEQQAEARQRYAGAMQKNAQSSCAAKGLGLVGEDDPDKKNKLAQAEEDVGNFFSIAAKALIALLVAVGIIALLWSLWKRWRNPSLAVEAFADGAVDAKVGSAVAALTEKRLIELSRRGRNRSGPYQLDVAVADVELVAESESLATAMGGLAEESQFKLAAAILGLVDRYVGTHLVAQGELTPKGDDGRGLLVALKSQGNGLRASGALWNPKRVQVPADGKDVDPSPYYELAEEAAAWIQFEVARCLDGHVGLITTNGKSFTALVQGIEMERADRPEAAAEYYALALSFDRENVAALFNLSGIVARLWGRFDIAISLLDRAGSILKRRHEEHE
jgi:tetratricopeptide (TPR) repeat protein